MEQEVKDPAENEREIIELLRQNGFVFLDDPVLENCGIKLFLNPEAVPQITESEMIS